MKIAIIFSPDLTLSEIEILASFVIKFASSLQMDEFQITLFSDYNFKDIPKNIKVKSYKKNKFMGLFTNYDIVHNFDNKNIALASLFFKEPIPPVINTFTFRPLKKEILKHLNDKWLYILPLLETIQDNTTCSGYFAVHLPDKPEINELGLIEKLLELPEKKYIFYSQAFHDKHKLKYYLNKNLSYNTFIDKNETVIPELLKKSLYLVDLSDNILLSYYCFNYKIKVFTTSNKPAAKYLNSDSFIFNSYEELLVKRKKPEEQLNTLPSFRDTINIYKGLYRKKTVNPIVQRKKLNIAFYANTSDFDGGTPYQKGLGGTESAVVYISRQLAKLGHNIVVFSHTWETRVIEGVTYYNRELFYDYAENNNIDILICLRSIFLWRELKARIIIFWTEDDADQDAVREFIRNSKNGGLADKIFVVSNYQKHSFISEFKISSNKFYVTRNGINPDFFEAPVKPRDRLIYTSTPYKGLKALLKIFPELRKRIPDIQIDIYSSMSLYSLDEADSQFQDLYREITETEGLNLMKPVSQPEIARRLQEALLLVYPNTFPETSCIAALEAQAAGTPVITSWLGALPETVEHGKTGLCIKGNPFDKIYCNEFVSYVTELLEDRHKWQKMSTNGIQRMHQSFTWQKIAGEWAELFYYYQSWAESLKNLLRFINKSPDAYGQELNSLIETYFFIRENFSSVKTDYYYGNEVMEKCLESSSLNSANQLNLMFYLGNIYYITGNKRRGLIFYQNALGLLTENIEPEKAYDILLAFYRITEGLTSEQKYDEALKVCKNGMALFPDNYFMLLAEVEIYSLTGNYQDAAVIIDTLYKSFPPAYFLPELPKYQLFERITANLQLIKNNWQ